MKKPKLTQQQCRWMVEVHQHVIRYRRDHGALDQAFCDVHDGNLYEREVAPLVDQGILQWTPMETCDRRPGRLLGCRKSVTMTPEAVRHFWPDAAP